MQTDDANDNQPDGQPANSSNLSKGKSTKGRKPKPTGEVRGKRSINLSMTVEDYERFYIHALRLTGGNISELVCKLGREHLRDYHISRTGNRATGE